MEEVADILAVELDTKHPSFDEDNRMPHPEDVLPICRSLVRINQNPEGRDSLGEVAKVSTLTAAHSSVVDFLKTQLVKNGTEIEASFTRAAMNLEMAETCLVYLLHFLERNAVLNDDSVLRYPLARLSAERWDDFYREILNTGEERVDMTRLIELAMTLFSSPDSMLKWVQLCDPDEDTGRVNFAITISGIGSALYYAALLGLPKIIRRLARSGQDVNERRDPASMATKGEACGTPLVAACVYGRETAVSVLLEEGADPDLAGAPRWGYPLAAAVEQDRADIVRLLLNTGKVDVHRRRYSSSQHGLGENNSKLLWNDGTSDIAEPGQISDTRTDVESKANDDIGDSVSVESLVYIAAAFGSSEVLDLLLEAGADCDMGDGEECSALQAACIRGEAEMVQSLLKHGADPKICGTSILTALQAACKSNSLPIVRLLIEAEFDVYSFGERFTSLY